MTTKRHFNVIFLQQEMTDIEKQLDNIEPSWADFAHAINPEGIGRIVRRTGSEGPASIRTQSLLVVHEQLEIRRKDFQGGDRSALFYALTLAIRENVPLPYWLGNEIQDIGNRIFETPNSGKTPSNLHHEFGLSKKFPISGTRAISNRRKNNWANQIWWHAKKAMSTDGINSVDAAVKVALKETNAPYEIRKATEMFNEVEQRQKKLSKPLQ